jgi:hypothetical protein
MCHDSDRHYPQTRERFQYAELLAKAIKTYPSGMAITVTRRTFVCTRSQGPSDDRREADEARARLPEPVPDRRAGGPIGRKWGSVWRSVLR